MILYYLVGVLVLCWLPHTACNITTLSTFSQAYGWYPPILEVDVRQLKQILTSSTQIKHSKPHLFEATLDETSHAYLIRINCILDEDAAFDFDLFDESLAQMLRLNQIKPDVSDHTTAYLSLIPGRRNNSVYVENLAHIDDIAVASPGVISHVLLDLSSVDVGPLDGFSLTQKYAACKQIGDKHGFKCGFIFDIRFCPHKMSIFGHIHSTKPTPVFLNTGHGTWKNLHAQYPSSKSHVILKCFLSIMLGGMELEGVMHNDETMILNSTNFEMVNFAKRQFKQKILLRIAPVIIEQNKNISKPECYLKAPVSYSNFSGNQSTSAVVAIWSEDLIWSLEQDIHLHNNGTHNGIPFFELFHRFLVRFPSVRESNDSSQVHQDKASMATVLKAVLRHSESENYKETYHLRPIELWIAFSPEENIREELKTVAKYGKQINSILPGTVLYVVLDYNNLRIDSQSVLSVVKSDVKTCNTLGNESNIKCGYVFLGRNCKHGSDWISQLPIRDDSVVLFRGQSEHIRNCLRARTRYQFGLVSESSEHGKIDRPSKSVTMPSFLIQLAEGGHYIYVLSISASYESSETTFRKPSYSGNWLHSPVKFSKDSVSFVVKLEDLSEKKLLALVSAQKHIVVEIDGLHQSETPFSYYLVDLCSSDSQIRSGHQISILIHYHPELANNLKTLDDILADVSNANSYCGDVITEILIDWNPCFEPGACSNRSPTYYNRYHFAGLEGITSYLQKIKNKSIKIGLFISSRTFAFLVDATNFVAGRWMEIADAHMKDRAQRLPSLFNVTEVLSMLDQYDVFVYKAGGLLAEIFDNGPIIAATKFQNYFETFSSTMTTIESSLFPNRNGEEPSRLRVTLNKCDIGKSMSSNQTLEYVLFWEVLSNWATKTGLVLIMDTAYQSSDSESCNKTGYSYKCACGWWTRDKSSGQLVDRKSLGVMLLAEETKRKSRKTVYSTNTATLLIVAPTILTLLIILSVLIVIKMYRKRTSTESLSKLASEFPSNEDPVIDMSSGELIGKGASKTLVYKCTMKTGNDKMDVAVKSFKSTAGTKVQTENLNVLRGLISEAKTLRGLKVHENIVKYFGICTSKLRQGELQLVLEYCCRGSLSNILPSLQDSTQYQNSDDFQSIWRTRGIENINDLFFNWSTEIASGLEHLVSENIVHADIATRNILLDQQMCCKICDFGLSRRMDKYKIYVKNGEEPLPWRWMAPESLRKLIFNEKTDVWMYGVTLWEIYTFGQVPFGGLSWSTDFVRLLEGGFQLETPSRIPTKIAQLVKICRDLKVDNRPTFSECKSYLINE